MKLYAIMAGDRGKPVTKSSNDTITITVTKDRRQKFDITFDGDKIEVMSYADARIETVEYMKTANL